jgi:hypothetical protein
MLRLADVSWNLLDCFPYGRVCATSSMSDSALTSDGMPWRRIAWVVGSENPNQLGIAGHESAFFLRSS